MKGKVELNNNGLSIESHCKVFIKKKWESRYILCKAQADLGDPMFLIYKCRKDRQKNKIKQSMFIQSYVGLEKSFTLKNKFQTLAIITKNFNIILSFQFPETLLQWETWFKNVGGQSTTHYMQLMRFPNQHENSIFVNKEVKCHLHDSRLALIYGNPIETLLFCEVSSAAISIDSVNHLVTIKPNNTSNEEFLLKCPSIEMFAKFLDKATSEEGLTNYLNKKNADGIWIQTITKKVKQQDSISHWSDTLSGFFNFMNVPSTSTQQNDIFSSRSALNRSVIKTPLGNRKIKNDITTDNVSNCDTNYVNTYQVSPKSVNNCEKKMEDMEEFSESDAKQRSTSLPEYVNVHHIIKQSQKNELIHRKASTITSNSGSQRFLSMTDNQFNSPMSMKGRSMMDFSSLAYEDNENRYENWRKAKKFISAFSPKSQQDLNRTGRSSKKIMKASSTSALMYDPLNIESKTIATSSMSELEDMPPSLNVAMLAQKSTTIPKINNESDSIPNGLIRVKDETRESTLKARGGVNLVLARRLATGVNGSYSKYDGEKCTHIYQGSKPLDYMMSLKPLQNVFVSLSDSAEQSDGDAIENAISRERQKMKQSDRRASSTSFQKNLNVHVPMLTDLYNKVISKSSASTTPTNKKPIIEQSNQISSNESISSEARSKISIKKRSNSPPIEVAPMITPLRQNPSQRTLTLQKMSSSSIDSLSSHKTLLTQTSIKLPTRIVVNNSSSTETSSEESGGKNSHYENIANEKIVFDTPIYHKSISRNSSRRMSEEQGSISSDVVSQSRKGYFRKNNKSRRSQRTLDESTFNC